MGIPVMIMGKSGSGKSTSLMNFAENELYLIKGLKKPLPFKKKFASTIETDDYQTIMKAMVKSRKKAIVIDDAGYLITNKFMREHSSTGGGNAVFDLYNNIGDRFWRLINCVTDELPEDKIVYFMMHEDKSDMGDVKPKTIGKLLDEKVCLEGMFTIILRCITEDGKHIFKTKTDGADVTKSPMSMFNDERIDNDLKEVDVIIRNYYGIEEREENDDK
jgi:hypothetical protein|nr:MAG TPA: AAA domain protein [Caudoviricetes sp.]